ncbi:GNAT family N-acetyltransferase [Arenicella xantha]|uniref:Putative acetyltransferase n=1 Tax=Arenicella xantha TaxID=644221 RepID=A0A395JKF0_9GAMM|nr:GNAT family N-acetyltransferase [Arenicella xantha]RBP51171.1 putative acetyltransferase [Arenicella xantha]
MEIRQADFSSPQLLNLLQQHLSGMQENSPPESVYALDFSGLQAPDVSFWAVWEGEQLLGFGALKQLSNTHGEIKSMRTHHAHLRRGVSAFLLRHIIALAKQRRYQTLSLETGSGKAFLPAIKLYRSFGFVSCGAFSDYQQSSFNQFMALDLTAAQRCDR